MLLVVEVADTSLRFDRTVKPRLYASSGIPEYWIVDASAETLEVYRSPSREQYGQALRPARGTMVGPQAFPDATLSVDAIFV